jgi:hypothetical protein
MNCKYQIYGTNTLYPTGPRIVGLSIGIPNYNTNAHQIICTINGTKDMKLFIKHKSRDIIQVKYLKSNNTCFGGAEWEQIGLERDFGNDYDFLWRNKLVYHKTRERPLIISMTSIPSRIKASLAYIEEHLEMFPYDSTIEINLPSIFKRTEIPYPEVSSKNPRIKIIKVKEDLGPITKILPTLERYQNKKVFIVSLDDDQIYPPHYIEKMYQLAEKAKFRHVNTCLIEKWASIYPNITGFSGVGYPSDIINVVKLKTLYNQLKNQSCCFVADDFVISLYLKEAKIPVYDLHQSKLRYDNPILQHDGLKNLNGEGCHEVNYKKCLCFYNNNIRQDTLRCIK